MDTIMLYRRSVDSYNRSGSHIGYRYPKIPSTVVEPFTFVLVLVLSL